LSKALVRNADSCFVFRRTRVQISARRQAILAEVIFLRPFQENAGIVP